LTVTPMTVLVVGATGSIGRLVVDEALRQGHVVRALVRTQDKSRQISARAQVIIGDVTRPDTLRGAVSGVGAIVFTLGSDGLGKVGAETIDYGGVRNVLAARSSQNIRIALMTAIGVTDRTGMYNRTTEAHDWKRGPRDSCAQAAYRTRSCVPAGSTTTLPASTGSSFSKVIGGTPAIPAMAS